MIVRGKKERASDSAASAKERKKEAEQQEDSHLITDVSLEIDPNCG